MEAFGKVSVILAKNLEHNVLFLSLRSVMCNFVSCFADSQQRRSDDQICDDKGRMNHASLCLIVRMNQVSL
mgnify:CR=1 FL=1